MYVDGGNLGCTANGVHGMGNHAEFSGYRPENMIENCRIVLSMATRLPNLGLQWTLEVLEADSITILKF